jgi:putative DNA primase/helicase
VPLPEPKKKFEEHEGFVGVIPDWIWKEWTVGSGVHPMVTYLNVVPMSGSEAVENLNFSKGFELPDGFWVSSTNIDSTPREFGQFKPKTPVQLKKGKKPAKYITPLGMKSEIILLETGVDGYWQKVIDDITIPLLMSEGGKKTGAGLTVGYPTVGLTGVWNGQVDKKDIIESLKPFVQPGRKVILAFDSDFKTNDEVQRALNVITDLLIERGCTVLIADWDTKYKGLDDLLVGAGRDAVIDAIENAKPADARPRAAKSNNKQLYNLLDVNWGHRLRFNLMSLEVEMDATPWT